MKEIGGIVFKEVGVEEDLRNCLKKQGRQCR